MFREGQTYTRSEIHQAVGGSVQSCLVRGGGRVVAVCFVRKKNPHAPKEIFVAHGPSKEAAAEILKSQTYAVPVFEKLADNAWSYIGEFKGHSYDTLVDTLAAANRASNRNDIAGVLHLESVT